MGLLSKFELVAVCVLSQVSVLVLISSDQTVYGVYF